MTRDANRARVLRELTTLGTTSRAEIARRTGLSPSTVSGIVAALQRDGLVIEQVLVDGPGPRGGRPASGIALHRNAGVAVGVDFGKRHLAVAVCDLGHEVLAETWQEMDEDYPAELGLRSARKLIGSALAQAESTSTNALGVGIGLPGPVHVQSGTLGSSTILPGWSGVRLGDVERHFELPVYIDNDANLGARAESLWGAGRGVDTFAFLKVSTGIGSGLIANGRVLSGAGGTAGDLLLNPMRESLELRAIPSAAADAEIVPAELGERAELLGALALVLERASEFAGQGTNQLRGGVNAR